MLIHEKLSQIGKQIKPVPKTVANKPDGYKVRGIYEIYNELGPLFAEAGVSIVTNVLSRVETLVDTNKGKAFKVVVQCKFSFVAEDGTSIDLINFGEGIDVSDKATTKATTAAIKYALTYLFLIPIANYEDADATTISIKPFVEAPETLKEPAKSLLALVESKGLTRHDLLKIGEKLGLPKDSELTREQRVKLYYYIKDTPLETLLNNLD